MADDDEEEEEDVGCKSGGGGGGGGWRESIMPVARMAMHAIGCCCGSVKPVALRCKILWFMEMVASARIDKSAASTLSDSIQLRNARPSVTPANCSHLSAIALLALLINTPNNDGIHPPLDVEEVEVVVKVVVNVVVAAGTTLLKGGRVGTVGMVIGVGAGVGIGGVGTDWFSGLMIIGGGSMVEGSFESLIGCSFFSCSITDCAQSQSQESQWWWEVMMAYLW